MKNMPALWGYFFPGFPGLIKDMRRKSKIFLADILTKIITDGQRFEQQQQQQQQQQQKISEKVISRESPELRLFTLGLLGNIC